MRRLGPGILVTAAFIGPGTITTASVAGADYGFGLLWALLFSVLATVVLQEMAARLGLVTGKGLSEALRATFSSRLGTTLTAVLVLSAVGVGNAAFETGNIMGAAMGLEAVLGWPRPFFCVLVGVSAGALLRLGAYKAIERLLVVLVVVMSVVFLVCMAIVEPSPLAMLSGMLVPTMPTGSTLTIVALIGTTVVPYNLFLHASSVREKWSASVPTAQALKESRADTVVAIGLGGIITMAIMTTAAAAFFARGTRLDGAASMAQQLEPLLGSGAKLFFATGLFAAGLSSAITAPLAAAYATSGVLGWRRDLRDSRFQAVWLVILVVGTVLAAAGERPVAAIVFAQATNGLLLPIAAVFLLVVMNRPQLLREYRNGLGSNLAGAAVVLVVSLLGAFQVAKALGLVG